MAADLADRNAVRAVRNGLNFTERGFGVRGAIGVSDRGHTAVAGMAPGDVDWDRLFGDLGVRCLHARPSPRRPRACPTSPRCSRRLWHARGGPVAAQRVNRGLAPLVDIMLGNEEDFTACLGFPVPDITPEFASLDAENFRAMIADVTAEYANLAFVATTLRRARTATVNDWGAVAWSAATASPPDCSTGDTSIARLTEVRRLVERGGARVER